MNKQMLYVPTWTFTKNDVEQKNASYRRIDTREQQSHKAKCANLYHTSMVTYIWNKNVYENVKYQIWCIIFIRGGKATSRASPLFENTSFLQNL